ncbi:MAG: hypothetical protein QXZ11_03210 [Thermoproteota archaeon]
MSEDEEISELLKKSKEVVGPIYPVLVDKATGEIIDGLHRSMVDPKWPRQEIEVQDRKQVILIRLHAHYRRQISQKEVNYLLIKLAEELAKEGVPRGQIVKEVANLSGYSLSRVKSALPAKFKDKEKVEAMANRRATKALEEESFGGEEGASYEEDVEAEGVEEDSLRCPVCGSPLELRGNKLFWRRR